MEAGYRHSPARANLPDVNAEREIHFVTRAGTLCGARLTEPWTVSEARVTCDACQSVLLARANERLASVKQAVFTLTRIIKET